MTFIMPLQHPATNVIQSDKRNAIRHIQSKHPVSTHRNTWFLSVLFCFQRERGWGASGGEETANYAESQQSVTSNLQDKIFQKSLKPQKRRFFCRSLYTSKQITNSMRTKYKSMSTLPPGGGQAYLPPVADLHRKRETKRKQKEALSIILASRRHRLPSPNSR